MYGMVYGIVVVGGGAHSIEEHIGGTETETHC